MAHTTAETGSVAQYGTWYLVHQNGGGVGADGVERAVTQRDLAIESREYSQPKDGDRIDDDHGELEQVVVAEQQRRQGGRSQPERHSQDCAAHHR